MSLAQIKIEAQDLTKSAFESIKKNAVAAGVSLDTLRTGAAAALSALAVPVSVAGLAVVFNQARLAVDGLKDLEDATGSSIEKVVELDAMYRSVGGNIESLTGMVIKFNNVLRDADPDKGVGAVLKAIGLNADALRSMDPVDALRAVAVETEKLGSAQDRARVYSELFGKSVREAGPFMKDLAEAKRVDVALTKEQIEEVDKFNKSMARLAAETGSYVRSLSADFAKLGNEILAVSAKKGSVLDLLDAINPLSMGMRFSQSQKDAAQAAIDARRSQSGLIGDDSDPRAVLRRIERAQDDRPLASVLPRATGPGKSPGAGKDPLAEAKRYLETLEKQAIAAQELSASAQLRADLDAGRLGKVDAGMRKQLEAAAQALDMEKQLNFEIEAHNKLREEAGRVMAATQQEAARLYEATRTPVEKLNALEAEYLSLLEQKLISLDTYQRAVMAAHDAFEESTAKASESIKATADESVDQAKRLGDAFSSTFDSAFRNGMKLGDLLKKLAFDAINIQLLTPAAQKAGSALGGIVSSGLGSLFGGFRANGGPVSAGKGYVVGERGPEWFSPASSGMITPNHALGGAGSSIIQHITIDARGADAGVDARIRAAMAQTKQETLAAVQSGANRGGGFARALGRA